MLPVDDLLSFLRPNSCQQQTPLCRRTRRATEVRATTAARATRCCHWTPAKGHTTSLWRYCLDMDLSPLAQLLSVSCSRHTSVDTYTCYIIMVLVSCSRLSSVDTYTCYIECWLVVADTRSSVDNYTCYIECWSVVADRLVLILTPVTLSVG